MLSIKVGCDQQLARRRDREHCPCGTMEAWKLLGEWLTTLLHLSWWDGQDISAITHLHTSLLEQGATSVVSCQFFISSTPLLR